ncbi:MAG: 30S ribosomal protein S8e [Candidatus Argoarchaeum ethanivorans]|uniref:Small ribosomal subunit protein eS8 n=1 Tax=Candidatus Argoarchaeum ethanivorans TaxID=2608793 RepID=A0A811T5N7_9EURY|nr:MAG: 30S ribosomal protein S8e [Candidatus Argoarchaeum ethanivorans]
MRWQGNSKRKFTSGRLIRARGKRKFEIGRDAADTRAGKNIKKVIKCFGGNKKYRLLQTDTVNVTDKKNNTTRKATIETVTENQANQYYVRRDVMTKGAVIKTSIGQAKVTNKPGQDGIVNAVLVE